MIGTKLSDRYEVVSELGRGGMGVVYKANDPLLGREVAIKLISPNLLEFDIEQRFRSEAQTVMFLAVDAQLARHFFVQSPPTDSNSNLPSISVA